MHIYLKIAIFVLCLITPTQILADYSCSFSLGMQRASQLNRIDEKPTYIWNNLEAEIGYFFSNSNFGLLVSVNHLTNTVKYFGFDDRTSHPPYARTSIGFLGKVTVLSAFNTLHINFEAGPIINVQDIDYERRDFQGNLLTNFGHQTTLGGALGIRIVAPTRFANVFVRLRYTYTRAYYSYNPSGIGASIGIGFGHI